MAPVERFADSFWPRHFDFGHPSQGARPWLIGAGRAGEVAVNVLPPFPHALGRASGDAALAERALALYRRYPATALNRLTREIARLLGGDAGAAHARTACRQPGLIHLYKHWCDARGWTVRRTDQVPGFINVGVDPFAWALNVTIIGLPLGLWILNRIPTVMTLRPMRRDLMVDRRADGREIVRVSDRPQASLLVRAIWFLLIGWWLSGFWAAAAYVAAVTIVGLPIAFWMYDRLPAVTTLFRY